MANILLKENFDLSWAIFSHASNAERLLSEPSSNHKAMPPGRLIGCGHHPRHQQLPVSWIVSQLPSRFRGLCARDYWVLFNSSAINSNFRKRDEISLLLICPVLWGSLSLYFIFVPETEPMGLFSHRKLRPVYVGWVYFPPGFSFLCSAMLWLQG